jgi:hypothetical protein
MIVLSSFRLRAAVVIFLLRNAKGAQIYVRTLRLLRSTERWKCSPDRSNARCMANGSTARFTRRIWDGCGRRTRKIGKQRSHNLQRNTDSVSDSIARDCAPSSINGRRQMANDGALCHRCLLHTFTKCARAKINRGGDLISDVLPFGRLWYGEPNAICNAISYAKHDSRSHNAVFRVYDDAGNVVRVHDKSGQQCNGVGGESGTHLNSLFVFCPPLQDLNRG